MATDGGYSRDKNKIYSEQNHSRTVTVPGTLAGDTLIVGASIMTIKNYVPASKGILILNASGNADFVAVPSGAAGYNKLLATNASGNLVWIDKEV